MATACKTSVAAAAAVLLLLIAVAVAPVSASNLTAYSVVGCTGNNITWGCGCYNFTGYKGGYFFNYTAGQVGLFYFNTGCRGLYIPVFFRVRYCWFHIFNSVKILC
ncbi:unnamed protein product [Spirodela intermedia]|uniref:Antimicrobial peptide 1 n=2 Tax=Spirodela intermedia TaxID=51605 RepID=A0A7I8K944_SPIIN|nr:unnamed protein product [Spirodela intermedia]CAA6658107.1 unnamed protein product [Spirodela intermedia]CAA7394241.1 unnamed protein product [Spirodela intermedia]CAA7394250.1 unnamed protein product [Spirodela intermedia]